MGVREEVGGVLVDETVRVAMTGVRPLHAAVLSDPVTAAGWAMG